MKKIKILTICLLGAAALTSCSDSFLEEESKTQQSADEYYTGEKVMLQSVVASYSPVQWNDWNGVQYSPQHLMSDIMADDIFVGGSGPGDNKFWHLMANYESTPLECVTGIWSNMYSGIKRCNDALGYLQNNIESGAISEDVYKSLSVEERVLRAYYYIWLWKFWGNVPFIFERVSGTYQFPQLADDWDQGATEIYNRVIEDLEEAIEENALPMYWDEDNLGRMSQAAAYMIYADWVMYQKDQTRYAKALQYMEKIIADPHYQLDQSYEHLFSVEGEWGSESIFEVNYSDNKTIRGWGTGDAIYAGGTVVPRLCSAPAPFGEIGTNDGWGFAPVRPDAYAIFQNGDTRRDVSILDVTPYIKDGFSPRYQNTNLWLNKHYAYAALCERSDGDKQMNYGQNLRVYRYAETLLNAAELLLKTGGDAGKAKIYLNMVRNRAGLNDMNAATEDNILDERRHEFFGEGKRYWDLVRTGKAAQVLRAEPNVELSERTNNWTESRKYLPIPYNELAADQSLRQNPNY